MGQIQSFGPGEAFAWCFFLFFFLCVTLNPTKLGFHSPHPQALPLLNLSSAAPDSPPPPRRPCGVAGGTHSCSGSRCGAQTWCVQMLSMRPRLEEHPVRRPRPYGLKGKGLLWSCWSSPWEQRLPLSPALPSTPLNGAERHCTGL